MAELRERQRVCRGAVKNKIDIAISLEDLADTIAYARRPLIFAV